ncbi:MAG TPA: tetratricopeptide repeat protein [Terracidiphilus sp.]|nr:tetratricopeptide repeat protein [Terracidiphilus sp.]
MLKAFTVRHRSVAAAVLAAAIVFMPVRAHAASKEIIALQTQVQQLLDMVQRMQSTLDQKFGVLQHLVEQTADNANQMTQTVNSLQQKLNQQNDALSGKIDTASGQVQSLNDSVDELKTRIAKLDKSVQDLQNQLQNIQAPPAGTQPGIAPTGTPEGGVPSGAPGVANPPTASAAPAPPLKETFQAALRDYNAAKYSVASGEFQDVIHYYPLDDLAGSSQFYLGEIAYRQQDYAEAIKNYNAVLENFSGSAKASTAQLHKGFALISSAKKEAGIHELRLLIQRHPQTPEAAQARAKLNALGVHTTASQR